MNRLLALLTTLALPPAVPTLPEGVAITSSTFGISSAKVDASPTSAVIDMRGDGYATNQLSLSLVIWPGSTTAVTAQCFESPDGTYFDEITVCDTASPSACLPDKRTYTLSNYTATSDASKRIASRWAITKRYVKCKVTGSGTATLYVSAVRSWQ